MASYTATEMPTHSGLLAAAFTIDAAQGANGSQARCARRGILPEAAYYGAWYFIPQAATIMGNWNLFHFLGGDGEARAGLWDVSLRTGPSGELLLYIRDFERTITYEPTEAPVPIGQWFHIQFYLRRAADATGQIALYQDGVLLHELSDVITDRTTQGAWYIGNLSEEVMPPNFTLYVDDLTISNLL
jgi:hypothetical protein